MDPVILAATSKDQALAQWAIAEQMLSGQAVSGDGHLVCPCPDGLLFAAIDGLGHGEDAADATRIALATLKEHPAEPIAGLLKMSHEALRGTRGAAISLASFDAAHHSMRWLGVGNVEGVLLRRYGTEFHIQENITLFPGIVGHQLPHLRPEVIQLEPRDLLIFFTDGIRRDFLLEPISGSSPEFIARGICTNHNKGNDDALVLVVRF